MSVYLYNKHFTGHCGKQRVRAYWSKKKKKIWFCYIKPGSDEPSFCEIIKFESSTRLSQISIVSSTNLLSKMTNRISLFYHHEPHIEQWLPNWIIKLSTSLLLRKLPMSHWLLQECLLKLMFTYHMPRCTAYYLHLRASCSFEEISWDCAGQTHH